MNPRALPIYGIENELRRAVAANPVVVVESPTGSGKTTQIPQILHRAGLTEHGVIGVTQPRRIAAVSVSARIAQEMGTSLGDLVGYKMRFADQTGPDTRIKVMTDGILLQELKTDPMLSRYAMIMVDEAHERSLNIDFVLGLLKRILRSRSDLHVLVSSATINAQEFCDYFDGAPLLHLDVKPYPVDIHNLRRDLPPGNGPLVDAVVAHVERALSTGVPGDVLVFLPGEATILEATDRIRHLPVGERLEVIPLMGRLSKEEQDRVFDDFPGRRKIVVATNIAETSVTIDGIRVVVDSGVAKVKSFDHTTGIGALQEQLTSRASCEQRLGRAGRTAPGVCYRLYSRRSYRDRPAFSEPEIRRTELSEVALRMLSFGIRDAENFDFVTPPAPGALRGAIEILQSIGAVTRDLQLTEVGERMVDLPLEPRIGRMVIEAAMNAPDVVKEVVTVGAFLSARTPFALVEGQEEDARAAHRSFADRRGDFHTYLKLFRAYQADSDPGAFCRTNFLDRRALDEIANIRQQILQLLRERGYETSSGGSTARLLRTVTTGLVQFVCRRDPRKSGYRSVTSRGIFLHPGSALFRNPPELLVAGEIIRTRRTFARSAARIEPEWLAEVAPETYEALYGPARGPRLKRREEVAPPPESVEIGGRSFPVARVRGDHLVTITAEELLRLPPLEKLRPGPELARWRAQVLVGEGVLMRGARLEGVLHAAPYLRLAEGVLEKWPRDDFFTVPERVSPLMRALPDVLRVIATGSRRRTLGFLTLCGNGNCGYWYDLSHTLEDALVASTAALEQLACDLNDEGLDEEAMQAARHLEEVDRLERAFVK